MSDDLTDREWPRWEPAGPIERTPGTVAPPADRPATDPTPDYHVWDSWPLRSRDGTIATIDGWRVLIALTAPADVTPGERHDIATHRYFVSRDGRQWVDRGPVFEEALGTRQWAGSALLDGEDCYLFYTAAGDPAANDVTDTQRLAVAHGGRVAIDASESVDDTNDAGESVDDADNSTVPGPTIEGPWTHEILFEPDGTYYETQAQAGAMTYTFRDPWFFEDPATGRCHLLFESNTPAAADACGGDAAKQAFNGCVGRAVSPTGDLLDWEFRPPIFDSVCVNQEIERPHVVVREGRYYLFVSSHVDTFGPGLAGYDALYGFVADSLCGDYRPLNDSGLVVTNPATAPFQAYSWLALPHDDELLVTSFLNYPDFEGDSLDGIAAMSPAEQRREFAGTLTPTLRLAVDGDRTRIRGTLDHWHLPTADEPLPPVDSEWQPSTAAVEIEPGRTEGRSRRTEGPFW